MLKWWSRTYWLFRKQQRTKPTTYVSGRFPIYHLKGWTRCVACAAMFKSYKDRSTVVEVDYQDRCCFAWVVCPYCDTPFLTGVGF